MSHEQFDPRLYLVQSGFRVGGVLRMAPIKEEILIDESGLSTNDVVARSNPGIVQERLPAGKGQHAAKQRGSNRHRRTLIVILEQIRPEAGKKFTIAIQSRIWQAGVSFVDQSHSACNDLDIGPRFKLVEEPAHLRWRPHVIIVAEEQNVSRSGTQRILESCYDSRIGSMSEQPDARVL